MRSIINLISLVLFVSLFLFTPFDEYKRMIILIPLLSVWVFSSILLNRKSMVDTIPLFVMLFFIMIIYFIYSGVQGNEDQFRRFFTHIFWTYIWGVIGVFYAANLDVFKKSIPWIVAMISVSCVYTIIGNLAFPGASRILAGSEKEGSQIYNLLQSMNIGGYGFIYALVFAVFPSALWCKKRLGYTLVSTVFLILLFGTLLVGSYFTSIILAFIALIVSLSSTRKLSTFIIAFAVFSLVVLLFKNFLLQGLVDFGALIDSQTLQNRAQEMIDGSYQEEYDIVGDYSRFDRMMNAIHNIGLSPIWGGLFEQPIDTRPSGHSELLGYFERFGLLGSLFLYYFYSIQKKIKKRAVNEETKKRISYLFALFIFLITINTFDIANSTGCVVFFWAPCLLIYIEQKMSLKVA